MDVLSHQIFWGRGNFHGVPPLMNNASQTSFGKDLAKIRPAIAKQSRKK